MLDTLVAIVGRWDMLIGAIECYVFGEYCTEWCIHKDI